VTLETGKHLSRRVRFTIFLNHNFHQNLKKLENIAGNGNHLSRPEDYGDAFSPVKRKNRQNKIKEILSKFRRDPFEIPTKTQSRFFVIPL
jgi:hypothetical protein